MQRARYTPPSSSSIRLSRHSTTFDHVMSHFLVLVYYYFFFFFFYYYFWIWMAAWPPVHDYLSSKA